MYFLQIKTGCSLLILLFQKQVFFFFFSDYILTLLSSIAVLDLGDMALEYIEGSQESGLISGWQ